jgi:ankyrin repeat protein
MKRTISTAFHQPNNNTDIPDDDADNDPAPKRMAPTMHVRDTTSDPIAPTGPSPATPIQALGPTTQPLLVARGQTTVSQQASESTRQLSMQAADVNLADKNGQTRLMLAVRDGHLPTVQALLFHGANINLADDEGWTALMFAARSGHLAIAQALLGAPGIKINTQKSDGASALYLAVLNGHYDLVKALIKKGADVNVADNEYWTPLLAATSNGHLTTAQALLDAPGIDINATDHRERTALYLAALNDSYDIVKVLIDKGANVNITADDGWTPLMVAAEKGHLTTMQTLLGAPGININAQKSDGATALYLAALNGNYDVVRALINKGADVNVEDNKGWTALMPAARNGYLTTVQALLGAPGIDINAKDDEGSTAVYLAALNGNDDVVKALLDHGAEINQLLEKFKTFPHNLNDDSDDDDSDESRVPTHQLLMNYLARRQADVGNLNEEATWASAFATSAIPPKASQAVIPPLQALALDTLIQQAQVEGPSLLQISFQATRDQLLQQKLSATQVVRLISTLSNGPFANALAQTLAVAIKFGAYYKKSDLDLIYEKLNVFGLFDAYKKSQARLESGNINRWQVSGQTLLTRAAQAGDPLLVDALINCGATIYLPDQHGNNALHAAVKAGKWSVCSHLLALGANPNTSDRSGVSTLTYLAQAFARGDEQTAAFVASLLAPLLAKGHRLDRVVNDPDALEEETKILEILRSDLNRYVLYADLLHADGVNHADNNGWTPLMLTAKEGRLTTVQTLLGATVININAQKFDGATALYLAAVNGNYDIVKVLIDKGANVNVGDNNYRTPLMVAAKKDHLKTVQALLGAPSIDINATDDDGATALYLAALNGNDDVVKALINQGANVNVADHKGWTPLMSATKKGHLTTVQALLGAPRININAQKSDGVTALYLAALNGHYDLVKALIDQGGDVSIGANDGWTPLMLAAEKGHLTTVQALLGAPDIDIDAQKLDGATALIVAAANGKNDLVKALIDKGGDVNIRAHDGWPPLIFAAEKGHLTTVQALLSAPDIDIDAQISNGVTALYLAALNGKDEFVKALINKGANVNVRTNDGWTPLVSAAEKGHLTTVQALLGAPDIDIDAQNVSGATALIFAAMHGHLTTLQRLIEKGANVNITDNGGWTPLMLAIEKGHPTTAQALLSVPGIDINAQTSDGVTALYLAALNGHYDLVKALIDQGGDVSIGAHDGWTPLMLAIAKGHMTTAQAILESTPI